MPMTLNLSRKELLTKCIQVISTYDPKRTTVDAYVDEAPALKDKRLGELEQKFIHQVFYGCIRYQKFLKVFVTSFLYKCPTTAIRADQTLYSILAYLLFFRLEEIDITEFREFFRCGLGTDPALFALLQYVLDVEELEQWVKVEWCKLYDLRFIEEDVIGGLQRFKEDLRPLLDEVELKATGTVASAEGLLEQTKRKPTVFEPFNLTKPRPRLIPEPEPIPRLVKATPIPSTLNKQSLADVESEKRQRLEEEKARVLSKYSADDVPQLVTAKRVDKHEREELVRKVEAERFAECTFKPAAAKKYVPPTEEAVVRQTVGSVLREDALIRKKQQQEAELLKRYEEDLHDASKYHEWQTKQKIKDDLEEEERVRQRMVEMQISREEAIEAQKSCVRKKQILAEHLKQEAEVRMDEYKQELQLELLEKKALVAETQEDRDRARIAEQEAEKARAKAAAEVRTQLEADGVRKRREDEQEMERRKDLIRQIRALEKVPVERFKVFDPAEAPAHGFLEEMSLAELRERLKIVTDQREKEREAKRERQLGRKLEKQEELSEKARDIAKVRERAREDSISRHAERKAREAEMEERKARYKEKCVEEAWARIEEKKKSKLSDELKLKKELQTMAIDRRFRQANAEMMEGKAHMEQQRGLEREARERQRGSILEQRKLNDITQKDSDIRRLNAEQTAYEVQQIHDSVRERMEKAKAEDKIFKEEIRRANSAAREAQFALATKGRAEFGHSSNRYMQKVTARGTALMTGMSVSA